MTVKRINLLPQEQRKGRAGRSRQAFALKLSPVWLAGPGVLLLVWAAIVINRRTTGGQSVHELRRLKAELQSQVQTEEEHVSGEKSALHLQETEVEAKSKSLEAVKRPGVLLSDTLVELAGLLPSQIWITKLAYSSRSLTITGTSDDASAVTALMALLEKSGKFSQTTFGYTRRAAGGKEENAKRLRAFVFEISTAPILGLEKSRNAGS